MQLRHNILFTGLVSLILIFSVSLASSAPATATIAVNVRNGPGADYLVLDTLEAGEQVNTSECANGWCYVLQTGPDGWVAENYLRIGPPQRPGLIFDQPALQPEQPGLAWPDQSAPELVLPDQAPAPAPRFSWPLQPAPAPFNFPLLPAPGPSPYRACFFDGEDFSGESQCVTSTRSFSRLGPAWNDRISSLKVQPGAGVTLCNRADFKGLCRSFGANGRSFGANVAKLPRRLNNQVTSGRVF